MDSKVWFSKIAWELPNCDKVEKTLLPTLPLALIAVAAAVPSMNSGGLVKSILILCLMGSWGSGGRVGHQLTGGSVARSLTIPFLPLMYHQCVSVYLCIEKAVCISL